MKQLTISASDFLNSDTIERRIERFEGDIGYPSNIAVWLNVSKVSDDKIYVSGAVEGYIEIECSRCLSVYRHPVEIDIESDMDLSSGETDMGEEIRQLIVLEIPSKPLCSPDCPGICPVCGKHNKENDKCGCSQKQDEDFAKQRWKNLFKK
ncbi:MAG: DUF177 domain-containing protein [Endomicrobium sp.]|jgi:uncharacterized protein|nr:DUF177 domain-containing protein [Endomicrobium sp.]